MSECIHGEKSAGCAVCHIEKLREENYTLRARCEAAEASLEEYQMRLAGALTTSEGSHLDVQDDPRSLEYLRTCPTIRSVVALRRSRDEAEAQARRIDDMAMDWKRERDEAREALRLAHAVLAHVQELSERRGGVDALLQNLRNIERSCRGVLSGEKEGAK